MHSETGNRAPGPGPRSLGAIIGEMFRLFGRHLGLVLLIAALVVVPLLAAGIAAFGPHFIDDLMGGATADAFALPLTAIGAVVAYLVLYAIGMLAVTAAVAETAARALAGLEPSIGRAYGVAVRRLPHMMGASIVAGFIVGLPVGIAIVLGTLAGSSAVHMLSIAVAVYLGVRLLFAPFIALFEQSSPVDAVVRSWRLVSGMWLRTFGLLLVIGLLLGLLQIVIELALGRMPVVEALLTSLVILPLSIIGNVLIYLDLRARKHSYGAAHLVTELESLVS